MPMVGGIGDAADAYIRIECFKTITSLTKDGSLFLSAGDLTAAARLCCTPVSIFDNVTHSLSIFRVQYLL